MGDGQMLSEAEGSQLLDIARKSIEYHVAGKHRYDASADPDIRGFTDNLEKPCGAFVTLRHAGQLRGCIGLIEAARPLWETVQDMAVAAAAEDPRFASVRPEELNDLDLEISVLSPLVEINSLKEIEVGKHGILIRRSFNSGLLLPQVATEHNWGLEEFLRNTCYKAGLNPEAWKKHRKDPDMRIFIFTAQLFNCPFRQ
jgi:AmmeMemoRadiSam system protein A